MMENDILERRGRGRPRKEKPFERVVTLRLNEDLWYKLQECVIVEDMSQADVLREAVEMYHNVKVKWRR